MTELPAPPDAASDPSATEVLRAWLIGETLHCSLDAFVFEDEAAWGAVLADLARHVASALHAGDALEQAGTLRQIREAFVQELGEAAPAQPGSPT